MMISPDMKEMVTVWERDFELDIWLVCHENEKIQENQIKIYDYIKLHKDELFEVCKSKIFEYVKKDPDVFPDRIVPENIFKFINPKAIIIKREMEYDYYGFIFLYRYDEENNICVSFKDGNFFEIGPEHIIL